MDTRQEQTKPSATSRRQVMVGAGAIALTLTQVPRLARAQAQAGGADFQRYVGSGFLVSGDDVSLSMILTEVITPPDSPRPPGLPQPFSLIFRSAPDAPALTGQIYQVSQTAFGSMSMFLSPISPDPSYYEAAFN